VGVSAFGVVTLAISVTFLTLFGLVDLPRARASIGALLYRDRRERVEHITARIITTTSRYMLGNLAISVICATVYGVTAAILGLPYALALALIAGILDLIPNVGALLAGIIVGIVALSVSLGALVVFVIVIVVYQQVELHPPTHDPRQSHQALRLHGARQRPRLRVAVRHHRGGHRRSDRSRDRRRARRDNGLEAAPDRRGRRDSRAAGPTSPAVRCSTNGAVGAAPLCT
jgi:AI-2E family transporter